MNDNSGTRIELLKAYLKDDPSDPFLHYALALEYIKINRIDEAAALLEIVLRQHPDYLPAYYQLGKLYEKLFREKEAIYVYASGIELARSKKDMHTLSELQGAYDMLSTDV